MRALPLGKREHELRRLARTRPQVTYTTPLKDLQNFICALRPYMGDLVSAELAVTAIVFEPTNLLKLCPDDDGSFRHLIEADGSDEAVQLLLAALSDWVDFVFTTEPATLLIVADHDEYVTFFPREKAALVRLITALDGSGYRRVDYTREL